MKNKIYINPENEEFGDFFELESGLVSWNNNKMCEEDLQFISVSYLLAEIHKMYMEEIPTKENALVLGTKLLVLEELKNLLK